MSLIKNIAVVNHLMSFKGWLALVIINLPQRNKQIGIMKYLGIFFLCLINVVAHAQFLSMNNNEIKLLKKLIKQDHNIKQQYLKLKVLADSSLAIQPMPVDTVFSEGRFATDPKKIKSLRALQEVKAMYALALTYQIENDSKYLNKVAYFLKAWARVNKPMENPINDTKFESAFEAYDLVKHDLEKDANETIKNWFHVMAYKELNHPFFLKKETQ